MEEESPIRVATPPVPWPAAAPSLRSLSITGGASICQGPRRAGSRCPASRSPRWAA